MWRYNHTSAYIVSRIAKTAKNEGLNAYRANSTECGASGDTAAAAAGGLTGATGGLAAGREPDAAMAAKSMSVSRACLPHASQTARGPSAFCSTWSIARGRKI